MKTMLGEKHHEYYCDMFRIGHTTLDEDEYHWWMEYTNVIFRWVFEKFLINKQGQPVVRYGVLTRPEDIVADIENLLRYP